MTIQLDHTIVLSQDKFGSALFLNYILGRQYAGSYSRRFAPVTLDDELNIDFADADNAEFERRTFTLLVSEDELDGIVKRLHAEEVPYGSEPDQLGNSKLNSRGGGRGLFFQDRNGHLFELTTAAYQLI